MSLEFVPAAKNGDDPGLCKCGCGEKTEISTKTWDRHGWVRGEPKPWIAGHQRAKRLAEKQKAAPKKPPPDPPDVDVPVEPLRSRLRSVLGDVPEIDTLIGIVAEACKPVRRIRIAGACDRCDCKHVRYELVPDAKVARETLAFVLDQTEGRPGVAGVDDAGVVVKLVYVGVDE